MIVRCRSFGSVLLAVLLAVGFPDAVFAQVPSLNTLFPAGGQIGSSVDVAAGGDAAGFQTLISNLPGLGCERLDAHRFRLFIPADAQPGSYDVWGVGDRGLSEPRTFVVSPLPGHVETEPNDAAPSATPTGVNVVLHGVIDKAADVDCFRFEARHGQRVVIDCQAERIDSRLRAVLEVFDASGRRLAVNRGYQGIDPLIDFVAPTDSSYIVKVQDLTATGGPEHIYRLDIDTGPRVTLAFPGVIQRGTAPRVTLYGWNLPASASRGASTSTTISSSSWGVMDIELPAESVVPTWPVPVRLQPAQAVLAGACLAYHLPGSHAPVLIGVTDVPVVVDGDDNHRADSARDIVVPCEVSGQLTAGSECDWFAFSARRGEVIHLEALGQRLGAPVDLQVSVSDATGERELATFGDEVRNLGGSFPTSHLDPAGEWLCPADGMYRLAIRNLIGGQAPDPRRVYRLSVRRAEPDFQLIAIPSRSETVGLNVPRGGRETLDILALRRRGFDGPIRISAKDLPEGIECPDAWLGPGVERTTLVVTADAGAQAGVSNLNLEGFADVGPETIRRPVLGGTTVRAGTPSGWGRLTSRIPFAVVGDAPLRITADGHQTLQHPLYGQIQVRHAPGGMLDVAVTAHRRDQQHVAPVRLSGVGLPPMLRNQTAVIPAGQHSGHVSFELPPAIPEGRYSLVIRAETTVLSHDNKTTPVVVHSPPVVFEVARPGMLVEIDPATVTRARRGETLQIPYTATRLNGFIGKMHTELAVPGVVTDIPGVRGRGETFTGQTERGSLQIVINDDAPLGPVPFLRLFTVGVLEDEPTYFGSRLLPLEIVE